MKNIFLLALIINLSLAVHAQTLSIGLSTSPGASIERINLGNVYNSVPGGQSFVFINYGYSIPVTLPIMYGQKHWRAGLEVSYEYIHLLHQVIKPDLLSYGLRLSPKIDIDRHLIKGGGIFEYDIWEKGKHTVGVAAEFGYYAIVGSNVSSAHDRPPYLYGSVGTRGSYAITPSLKLIYGVSLDVQGSTYKANFGFAGLPDITAKDLYYQPRLTIGIRQDMVIRTLRSKR